MTEKKVCWNCRFCKMDIRDGSPYCSLREKGGKCYAYDSWESQEDILDKLRAEIEQRPYYYMVTNDSVQGMKYERAAILDIIDKYKAESER